MLVCLIVVYILPDDDNDKEDDVDGYDDKEDDIDSYGDKEDDVGGDEDNNNRKDIHDNNNHKKHRYPITYPPPQKKIHLEDETTQRYNI